MICPCEKKGETSVVDSRPTEDGTAIRRRRLCSCGERFTTFERIQFRELMVVKKNGQSEISSSTIGTMVMEGLKDLDPVAYVRFASVYRNFREEKDFIQFVDKIDVFKKK